MVEGRLLSNACEICPIANRRLQVYRVGCVWSQGASNGSFSSSGGEDGEILLTSNRGIIVCGAVAAGRSWTRMLLVAGRMRLCCTPLRVCSVS